MHTTQLIGICSFELTKDTKKIQIFPDGNFAATDGRPKECNNWVINQIIANKLIAQANARKTDYVVDYHHQSLNTDIKAPAAGWGKALTYVAGEGVYLTIEEWTPVATAHIQNKEYKYISPVFAYDKNTGEVLELHSVALTNTPAIDGMQDVLAAAQSLLLPHEDAPMDKSLLKALGIDAGADDAATTQAALDAIKALKEQSAKAEKGDKDKQDQQGQSDADDAESKEGESKEGESKEGESEEGESKAAASKQTTEQQLAALQARVEAFEKNTQTAALQGQVKEITNAAFTAGKITAAQRDWAQGNAWADVAACQAWLKTQPAIAALSQTQRAQAAAAEGTGLTPEELAVCQATGTDIKDFLATKKQRELTHGN